MQAQKASNSKHDALRKRLAARLLGSSVCSVPVCSGRLWQAYDLPKELRQLWQHLHFETADDEVAVEDARELPQALAAALPPHRHAAPLKDAPLAVSAAQLVRITAVQSSMCLACMADVLLESA